MGCPILVHMAKKQGDNSISEARKRSLANLEKGKATQFKAGEQQARTAQRGGVARQAKARSQRTMYESLTALLSKPLKDGAINDLDQIGNLTEAKSKNLSVQDAVILAQIAQALKGNVKSANFIKDMLDAATEKKNENGVQIIDDL